MKITEINCKTGVEVIRDMNEEELANYNKIKDYIPKSTIVEESQVEEPTE